MNYFTFFCVLPLLVLQSLLFSVEQGFVEDPYRPGNKVEFFFSKPEGNGPFPVMFLLHGYQPPEKSNGGMQLVDIKYTDIFLEEGIVAVSISIPGFGNSAGKRDFFGPDSQKAVVAVIDYFKKQSYVDLKRIGLYGISRGADTAAMVCTFYRDIALQILESGMYNLQEVYRTLPDELQGIRDCIEEEAGTTSAAFEARSATAHSASVSAATLFLHGEHDNRMGLAPAKQLREWLLQHYVDCRLIVYPDAQHRLPREKWGPILAFVREKFFNLYGIGIEFEKDTQPPTIKAIRSNSSAERTRKLKVGDVVVNVSPHNDTTAFDTLHMTVKQLIPLILGKKNSLVRLRVQHPDQSYEDIVVDRNN